MLESIKFMKIDKKIVATLAISAGIPFTTNLVFADSEASLQGGSQASYESGSEATQHSTSLSATQNNAEASHESSHSSTTQNSSQAIVEAGRLYPPNFSNRPNSASTLRVDSNTLSTQQDSTEQVEVPQSERIANVENYHWSKSIKRSRLRH